MQTPLNNYQEKVNARVTYFGCHFGFLYYFARCCPYFAATRDVKLKNLKMSQNIVDLVLLRSGFHHL